MWLPLLVAAAVVAPLPSGWWVVDASNGIDVGLPGTGWRLGDEVIVVDESHSGARRTKVTCHATSDRSWHCERSAGNGIHTLDLRLSAGGELSVTLARQGQPPYGAMNARRAKPTEAASLDAVAQESLAEDQRVCGAAKRCYDLACPVFQDADHPCDFAHHSMAHDASTCRQLIPMLATTLRTLDKPIPPECSVAP